MHIETTVNKGRYAVYRRRPSDRCGDRLSPPHHSRNKALPKHRVVDVLESARCSTGKLRDPSTSAWQTER